MFRRTFLFSSSLVPLAAQEKPKRKLDVPYVPSTEVAVKEMLKMAKIQKGDVLYDLGCGDGRIVIAAAKAHGIRGVGLDIDPQRIKEARENARTAGVESLVRFEEKDLFQADFRDATVVTLFLLPSVNMKLRPKLLADLKPGTRVVSNTFDLGDWKAEKQVNLDTYDEAEFSGLSQTFYLWTVPTKR